MPDALSSGDSDTNVGTAERIGSAALGALLVGRALLRPSFGRVVLGLGGALLIQRGLTGYCGMNRKLGRNSSEPGHSVAHDPVDVASDDSFPASDPPSWTPVSGTIRRRRR